MEGPPAPPIRDAATVIVVRRGPGGPEVLMGQRGAGAVFMPSKIVFPGGAVDAGDHGVALATPLAPACAARLALEARAGLAPALAAAAIRELWEEAGLRLAAPAPWPDPPPAWAGFAAGGHRPAAGALTLVFRAITPPGRPRRFDARFFLVDADALAGDDVHFAGASGELTRLGWVPVAGAGALDLPRITAVVLAEVAGVLRRGGPPPEGVPFHDSRSGRAEVRRLP
ncbi:MAG: DNA mismatch repair protein MutT [Rhodobacteraceae bacterium]|nr:DNA mismatch repair protein MutT [Paracoccaceae bacterium]